MLTVAHFQVIHAARDLTSSKGDARMVPDAALGGAARQVVLHELAFERLNSPVVPAHGIGNNQLVSWVVSRWRAGLGQFETIGRGIELLLGISKDSGPTSSPSSCTCRTMLTR